MDDFYYKLGGKATAFYDPLQSNPDSQFLAPGQIKKLDETDRVIQSRKAEGLIRLSKKEAEKEMSEADKARDSAADQAALINADADKKLEDAKVILKQAETKAAEADKVQDKVDEQAEEIKALKKALKDKGEK